MRHVRTLVFVLCWAGFGVVLTACTTPTGSAGIDIAWDGASGDISAPLPDSAEDVASEASDAFALADVSADDLPTADLEAFGTDAQPLPDAGPEDLPPSVAAPAGMVAIGPGTFWMGCNSAKDLACSDQSDESPQHKVTLSAYFIDTTETRVDQYQACVKAGSCTVPAGVQPANFATYPTWTIAPVNYVTWAQARAFCKWRGAAFDLPTEAQWEMAARGDCAKNGSTANDAACKSAMRTFPWGEEQATCERAVLIEGGSAGCGANSPMAVGLKPAGDSPYGVHDLAGNLAEWTLDWYQASYADGPESNPAGPDTTEYKTFRGGAFTNNAVLLRSGARNFTKPNGASFWVGFRCARSYP